MHLNVEQNLNIGPSIYLDQVLQLETYLLSVQEDFRRKEDAFRSKNDRVRFVKEKSPIIFPIIDRHFEAIGEKYFASEDNPYLPIQTHNILLKYFYTAPLNTRIHDKPLGYDGDYITLQEYYNNGYEGKTAYDILMHRYSLHHPIALATINRFSYYLKYIEEIYNNSKGNIQITSLGCGPANEIVEFCNNHPTQKKKTNFTCIDGELRVIKYLQEETRNIKNHCFNLLNWNILKYIKQVNRLEAIMQQDLIYAGGLFDYLPDKVASKLIERIYCALKPKGKMIITNFSSNLISRTYMELIGKWKLIYRDESSMLALCKGLKDSQPTTKLDKETKSLVYLTIIK